jgi:Protein of unknown function (DUF2442)
MTNNREKSLPYDGLYWVVEDAIFLKEYQVKLWFRDGSIKIVDFENYLFSRKEGSVFEPLKDKALFASVQYSEEMSNIHWGDIDIAPEWLYENGIEISDTEEDSSSTTGTHN